MRCLIACALVGVVCAACGCLVGYFFGTVVVEIRNHQDGIRDDTRFIHEALAGYPRFAKLAVLDDSSGYAFVSGTVGSRDEMEELRRLLIKKSGSAWAEKRLFAIKVAPGVAQRGSDRPPSSK
jgi:hypothetical protein